MQGETMRTTFKQYGTVAFDRSLMLEMVYWGRAGLDAEGYYVLDRGRSPNNLCWAIWMTVVPSVYRHQVIAITEDVAERYLGYPASKEMLERIIDETLTKIRAEIEPVASLTCEDWRY